MMTLFFVLVALAAVAVPCLYVIGHGLAWLWQIQRARYLEREASEPETVEENLAALKRSAKNIEERMRRAASKRWVFGGIVGGMAMAAALTVLLLR